MPFDSASAKAAAAKRHGGGAAVADKPAGPVDAAEAALFSAMEPPSIQQPRQPSRDHDFTIPREVLGEIDFEDALVRPEAYHLQEEDLEMMSLPGHNPAAKAITSEDVTKHGAIRGEVGRGVEGVAVNRKGPGDVMLYDDNGDGFLVPAQSARAVLRTGKAHYRCPWCKSRHVLADGRPDVSPNACRVRPKRMYIVCRICLRRDPAHPKFIFDTPPGEVGPESVLPNDPMMIDDEGITQTTPEQRLKSALADHIATFHQEEGRAMGVDVDGINQRALQAAQSVMNAFQSRQVA